MSLLKKFFDEEKEQDSENNLINSVMNQIAILFSNRNDCYWTYDFTNEQIIAIHEIFKLQYSSIEFSQKLAKAIEVFDRRIKNVKVNVEKIGASFKIAIDAQVEIENKLIKIPKLRFDI